MTDETEDWRDLQAAWRGRPEPDQSALEALRAQVRREQMRLRVEAAAEVAIVLFCAGVFLWWASGETGAMRALFVGLAVVSVVTGAVTGALRRQVWRAQSETVLAYRQVLLRRARLGLAFARMGYIGAPLGVGVGLLIARLTSGVAAADTAPSLMTAVGVIALATLAAGWVWSLREARRCRALIATLTAESA